MMMPHSKEGLSHVNARVVWGPRRWHGRGGFVVLRNALIKTRMYFCSGWRILMKHTTIQQKL